MTTPDDPFENLAPLGEGDDGGGEAFDGPDAPQDDLTDLDMAALLQRGAQLELNDDGNGQRFALYFGTDIIWVPRVGWYCWTGQVWAKDPDEIALKQKSQLVGPLVKREVWHLHLSALQAEFVATEEDVLARLKALEAALDDKGKPLDPVAIRTAKSTLEAIAGMKRRLSDIRAAHRRFAIQTGNSARMKSMREEASVRLSRTLEQMDANPWDINTESGVIRFGLDQAAATPKPMRVATQVLIPHHRDQLMTKMMPVIWDPDAECPQFDAFLKRIQPDVYMRDFLMRWFALSMTGATEQKLCFFYGMGANGKSVLIDLMSRIMGDYAAVAKIESLTGTNRRGGGDATPDLVPLIGARFVRAAEPDEGVRWQEGLIKDLTGGEPILVRALHSDFVEVRPIFSLTISGNHKPDIRGTDDGIWRRLLLVPFGETIPKAEQIPKAELDAMLFAERNGIFRKLCAALCDYREMGLREPDTVTAATTEFREESDPYGTFLDEACVVTGDAADTVSARELVNAFHFWMAERAEGAFKDRTVSLAMKERSRRWVSRRTGRKFTARKSSGTQRYDGIKFAELFAKRWDYVNKDAMGRATHLGNDADAGDTADPFTQ